MDIFVSNTVASWDPLIPNVISVSGFMLTKELYEVQMQWICRWRWHRIGFSILLFPYQPAAGSAYVYQHMYSHDHLFSGQFGPSPKLLLVALDWQRVKPITF